MLKGLGFRALCLGFRVTISEPGLSWLYGSVEGVKCRNLGQLRAFERASKVFFWDLRIKGFAEDGKA